MRELQEPGTPVFEAMVERWGERIVAVDGTLDRAAVAEIVFNDEDELKAINDIVHPALAKEIEARRKQVEGTDAVVVLDLPLLVRADGQPVAEQFDGLAGVIVVDIDPELAVERLVGNRGFREEDARNRIGSQASREDRLAVADVVIDNSGDLADLEAEIERVWAWIRGLSA